MPKCEHGLTSKECYVCASPKHAAQAEKQEPMVYDKTEMNCFVQELYDRKMQEGKRGHYETMFHCVHQAIKRLYTTTQLQQGEKSEPLDKVYICNSCGHAYQIQPPSQCDCLGDEKYTEGYIYTTPLNPMDSIKSSKTLDAQPQREWVGLTDEEIDALEKKSQNALHGIILADAKLKEKNT